MKSLRSKATQGGRAQFPSPAMSYSCLGMYRREFMRLCGMASIDVLGMPVIGTDAIAAAAGRFIGEVRMQERECTF